ncbi:MAG TPA: NAD(P)/FAD-dependent oxidoreductase [Deltaproteobacteria bacterium]|nr:NAD(P)/FAD-dependent oxidoreductase [Deltaproteobacteria bacterium]
MENTYDVIVLGGGPAGRPAAIISRRSGASVLIVEAEMFGGTCPLKGCIPKKVLLASAEIMENIRRSPGHRITVQNAHLDWDGLIDLKKAIIAPVPKEHEERLEKLGIHILSARARFTGRHSIEAGGREYHGKKFVIATGSRPRTLPIPGFENTLTSDELLELGRLPSSVVFIGSGPIGMEFTHVFLRAGIQVMVLDAAKRILPAFDEELVKELVEHTQSLGAKVIPGADVDSITRSSSGFDVAYRAGDESRVAEADIVINSAGRTANYEGLDLASAGIETDAKGIVLDKYLRSVSNQDVFVAGDAVPSSPQLSPVATYEGRIAAHNVISSDLIAPDYRFIPYAVYTIPPLAGVGLTEEQASARGLKFKTAQRNLKSLKMTRIYTEPAAFSKVLIEEETDRILGAHILGHDAHEIINIFGLAMKHGITSRDLREFLFAFPTFASDIPDMVALKG